MYISRLIDIWNNGDRAVFIDRRIPLQTATVMMHDANVHTCCIEKRLFMQVEISQIEMSRKR